MTLAAASATAGQTGPNVVRVANPPTPFGSGFALPQDFRPPAFRPPAFRPTRFDKHDRRSNFVAFRRQRHRRLDVPVYYYGNYGYDGAYGYPVAPQYQPSAPPESGVAPPPQPKAPVTPKWVHVGGPGAADLSGAEGAFADAGPGSNCLTVKTQITVDGAPVDAFGKACLLADGTWRLRPAKAND